MIPKRGGPAGARNWNFACKWGHIVRFALRLAHDDYVAVEVHVFDLEPHSAPTDEEPDPIDVGLFGVEAIVQIARTLSCEPHRGG